MKCYFCDRKTSKPIIFLTRESCPSCYRTYVRLRKLDLNQLMVVNIIAKEIVLNKDIELGEVSDED